jgi:hypothetical protein
LTIPNGASGIDNSTWVTTDTVSNLPGRTQDAVTPQYKSQVTSQPGITQGVGVLGGVSSLISSISGIIQSLINGLTSIFTGIIGAIGATIVALINGAAEIISALFGGISQTNDTIYNSVSGKNGSNINNSDTGAELKGLKDTVVSLQSSIQNMQYDALPQGGSIFVDDGSSPQDVGWGTNWTTAGDGTSYIPATPGGFWWSDSGGAARTFGGFFNGQTESDLQIVSMVLYTLMENPSPVANNDAGNQLRARVGDSGTSYVYARVYYNQVEIGFYVDGILSSVDFFPVKPTTCSLWELQCGTEEDPTEIIVYQNRLPVAGWTDTDGLSRIGSTYRGGGMDMFSDARSGGKESSPGMIAKWSMRDLAPPGITGTAISVQRLGAGTVTATHGQVGSVNADYFDTVLYTSTDLEWDTSNTAITVTKAGQYFLTFNLLFNQFYYSVTTYPAVFVNNEVVYGGNVFGSGGQNSQILTLPGFFPLALNAGDVVQPAIGINTTGNLLLTGDPLGQLCWMTLTKVG